VQRRADGLAAELGLEGEVAQVRQRQARVVDRPALVHPRDRAEHLGRAHVVRGLVTMRVRVRVRVKVRVGVRV
jgi:hypothetical protein